MSSNEARVPNIYAYHGRHLLSAYNDQHEHVTDIDPCKFTPRLGSAPAPPYGTKPGGDKGPGPGVKTDPPELPICIIGAGMAGLYTAMIFKSLGFEYQILEGSGRVGGRLFTYHFPSHEEKEKNKYDYFDVGAMRFPRTPFMTRTLDLIEDRGLKGLKLIPYVFDAQNTRRFYNNIQLTDGNVVKPDDPFGVGAHVMDKRLTTPEGVKKKVDEVLQPLRSLFIPGPGKPLGMEDSMKLLFDETNQFSMRSYMLLVHNMSPKDVHWCETLDLSTGLYDRALTEVVAESLAFKWPGKNEEQKWYCIDGGSDLLPKAMHDSLKDIDGQETPVMFNRVVTAISREFQKGSEGKPDKEFMKVSIDGEEHPQEYSAVVSTVPLPRLSLIDLTKADIHTNYAQWSAIRSLQYGPAIKIGIRFKEAWWEEAPYFIHGGQTKTDLPLRTIVYPSYSSRVLIVSYCWTQDADRLGALIPRDGTFAKELFDLVFRNLATVHGTQVCEIKKHFEEEKREENFFVWDWARDPLTMGAFAVFGPGVYEKHGIYSELLQPTANGRLFIAGEAASVCHGWVAGALDSAWRAVDQYLARHYPDPEGNSAHNPVREKFWELWGGTEYWDEHKNDELVERNHKISMRNLVINIMRDARKETK